MRYVSYSRKVGCRLVLEVGMPRYLLMEHDILKMGEEVSDKMTEAESDSEVEVDCQHLHLPLG